MARRLFENITYTEVFVPSEDTQTTTVSSCVGEVVIIIIIILTYVMYYKLLQLRSSERVTIAVL